MPFFRAVDTAAISRSLQCHRLREAHAVARWVWDIVAQAPTTPRCGVNTAMYWKRLRGQGARQKALRRGPRELPRTWGDNDVQSRMSFDGELGA